MSIRDFQKPKKNLNTPILLNTHVFRVVLTCYVFAIVMTGENCKYNNLI